MGWYRCSCGLIKEEAPRFGDTIVSVNHLHRAVRLDGSAVLVRMEEIQAPLQACEGACDPTVPDTPVVAGASASSRSRPAGAHAPWRRAA